MTDLELAGLLVAAERDLCLYTAEELTIKYAGYEEQLSEVFATDWAEMLVGHNPLWYYGLSVWYDEDIWKERLEPTKHRDILCKTWVDYRLGRLPPNDGCWTFWPRFAYKSTWLCVLVDWLGKRNLLVEHDESPIYYFHRVEEEAVARCKAVKAKNQTNKFIIEHFPEFVIPPGKEEDRSFSWPCRRSDSSAIGDSVNARGLLGNKAGKHGLLIFDDIETDKSRHFKAERSLIDAEYNQARKLKVPWAPFEVGAGTYYHPSGLGWKITEAKREDKSPRYFVTRIPAYAEDDTLNFPRILPHDFLENERLNEIAISGHDRFWYLQYQLDPHLQGVEAFDWNWVRPLDWGRFEKIVRDPTPKIIVTLADTAWKGAKNQQDGDSTAIATVMLRAHKMRQEVILLELLVSNELMSDRGAEIICQRIQKWGSPLVLPEMNSEKTFYGTLKEVGRRFGVCPVVIGEDTRSSILQRHEAVKFSRQSKGERIAAFAGKCRAGLFAYLEATVNPDGSMVNLGCGYVDELRAQMEAYPAVEHEDIIDCLALSQNPQVLALTPQSTMAGQVGMEEEMSSQPSANPFMTGLDSFNYAY
jgi:hypothetical protein